MNRAHAAAFCTALAFFGCSELKPDVQGRPAVNTAALGPNALGPNALGPNALGPNALGPNALGPNALSADAMTALQAPGSNGDLARELLHYAVSCAFDASQSFSFSWTDENNVTHDETYPGLIGLAPSWADAPLDNDLKPWVSACLVARVNYFGVSVMLSMRGAADALTTTTEERDAYTYLEGAFWGDVFSSTPTAFACNDESDDAHSRASQRVCAAGYDDGSGELQSCGIIQRVGSCADACGDLDGDYFDACASSSAIVTVYLE